MSHGAEVLYSLLDRPIAFHRPLVSVAGSVAGAVFLSQAIYWQRKSLELYPERGGWWFKTRDAWTEETGLSRSEQERARKALCAVGVLSEDLLGMPARMHYNINLERLAELLQLAESCQLVGDSKESSSGGQGSANQMAKSCQLDGAKATNKLARSLPTYKNTDKTTDENITTTTTTTNTTSVSGRGELIFPEKLELEELEQIRVAVEVCPEERRQDILDELAGALGQGDVRSPVGFFATLVRAAVAGTFTLQRGATVQARRRRCREVTEQQNTAAKERGNEALERYLVMSPDELRKELKGVPAGTRERTLARIEQARAEKGQCPSTEHQGMRGGAR